MDMPVGFTVKPLSPACGAEIIGLDLSRTLPRQTIDEIQKMWDDHIVLVFRDQDITEDEQLAFAGRFGELGARKKAPERLRARSEGIEQTNPRVMLVSNIRVDGKPVGSFGDGDMWFHIDSGYAERPYCYTFLYGVKLPSRGGNTRFANTCKAYDALPREMKDKLAGRKALHLHEYERRARVDISSRDLSDSPHWFHPVCISHPRTGRKALFVDRLMTRRIEGLDPADSEATLEFLYDHAEQEKFIFEHEWRVGDVVMWDNLASIHGRTWFPETEERLLRRCTVEGVPLHE
jgi:taurine dioxygenase